ncbi:MAG: hypothetical protein AAFY77_04490 [Pseudomonadota bacterium]
MTPEDDWKTIMSRITPTAPIDLDRLLGSDGDTAAAPPPATGQHRAPSPRLWTKRDTGSSYLGIRVTKPAENVSQIAAQLAAAAMERQVIPVILSHCERSGFERFGFRVERILADTPDGIEALEAEVARFWDMAIVIDLADVTRLG